MSRELRFGLLLEVFLCVVSGCGCCSFQTIGIVISTIIAISGANPIIRTAQMEGPCNIGDMTGDILEEHRTVNMLIHRAIAVIHLANRTKEVTVSIIVTYDILYARLPDHLNHLSR